MNLSDEVEVARFLQWVSDYHEADVVSECQRIIEKMVANGEVEVKRRGDIVSTAIQNTRRDELERGRVLAETPCVSELIREK